MSVAFKPGQVLTEDDLKIAIRDNVGTLVDPSYIRYSLFDFTTGIEVLIGSPDRVPATTGTGLYHVVATIPLDANIGDWLVRWNFRETPTSPLVQVVQEFNIVSTETAIVITDLLAEDILLHRLRILLRDNNPDRNYRFRPPSTEKFLQAQTQVFGYIWEEEELYEYLLMAVDDFNTTPPVTGITLNEMPDRWRTTILLRAASFACFAVAMNWIADEFSFCKDELVTVRDKTGEKFTLKIEELFDIVYEDLMLKVEKNAEIEFKEGMSDLMSFDKKVEDACN